MSWRKAKRNFLKLVRSIIGINKGDGGMRLFETDFKQKYVIAEVNGKEVMISFYDTFWKGIYNISVRINGEEKQITIKSTYPGFVRRIKEAVLLIKIELKHAIDRIAKSS